MSGGVLSNDRLHQARTALEKRLREHLRDFESFEETGASVLDLQGTNSNRMAHLLTEISMSLGISLPLTPIPYAVFQTPNSLLAFLSAAVMEDEFRARLDDDQVTPR